MKILFLSLMLLGACAAVANDAPAASGEISALDDAGRLTDLLEDLTTFKADVRQLITESSGGVLEESDILFMLQRPHGFYWETLAPFPELIVTDGESLWNYQPDLLQLTIEDWDPAESELSAQLLSGETRTLSEDYLIDAVAVDNGGWEFVLRPLDPASLYERVMLYFSDNMLESILLINTNGQRTLWEFFNREVNQPLDESVFTFEPPDDEFLDVIDNRSGAVDETEQL